MTWLPHGLQVSEFLFGDGFAISGGDEWRVRRKAVGPSLHKAYLAEMTDRVFGPSAQNLCSKLEVPAPLSRTSHGPDSRLASLFQQGRLMPRKICGTAVFQPPEYEATTSHMGSTRMSCTAAMPCCAQMTAEGHAVMHR